MKKIKTSIIFIFIALALVRSHEANALKRAIFPDAKSLQPIPGDVEPNFSGNTNSTLDVSPEVLEAQPSDDELNKVEPVVEKSVPGPGFTIWYIIVPITLIILFALYFIYRKKTLK